MCNNTHPLRDAASTGPASTVVHQYSVVWQVPRSFSGELFSIIVQIQILHAVPQLTRTDSVRVVARTADELTCATFTAAAAAAADWGGRGRNLQWTSD